jgi:hypothetical protein
LLATQRDYADGAEIIFVDRAGREPYKRYQDSNTPLNRILITDDLGVPRDMADFSPMIQAAEPYEVCRAYIFRDDTASRDAVENIIRTEIQSGSDGDA